MKTKFLSFFLKNERLAKKYGVTIVFSIVLSLILSFLYYISENMSTNFFDDVNVFAWKNHLSKDTVYYDDAIFLDVSYNVDTVHTNKGIETITDRKVLLDFLKVANRINNFKFIFLDLHFKEGQHKSQDDSLVLLINEMNRNSKKVMIVNPSLDTGIVTDSIFNSCYSAPNGYNSSFLNSNFTRYTFVQSGDSSAALNIYNAITESPIKLHSFRLPFIPCDLYKNESRLFINSPMIRIPAKLEVKEKRDLGKYLLKNNANDNKLINDLRDRLVFIGAFEFDKHNTYSGPRSGSHITYLALKELQNGRFCINMAVFVRLFVFYFLLLVVVIHTSPLRIVLSIVSTVVNIFKLFILSCLNSFGKNVITLPIHRQIVVFCDNKIIKKLYKKIPHLTISIIGVLVVNIGIYSVIFIGISMYLYSVYGMIYNIHIPILFFTFIESLKTRK